VWAFPKAYPFFPQDWSTARSEAEVIALEQLRDLGELPADPYTVITLDTDQSLEARLYSISEGPLPDEIRRSHLADEISAWRVAVYSKAEPRWRYLARVTTSGRLVELQRSSAASEETGSIENAKALERAGEFLDAQGVDRARLGEPEVISNESAERTDLKIRYPDLDRLERLEVEHGLEVTFSGERLMGFSRYFEDPSESTLNQVMAPLILLNQLWVFIALLLTPIVAVPFVRRYHQGEIGVERGIQIAGTVIGLGLVMLLFCARSAAEQGVGGVLARPQTTWVIFFQLLVLFFVPMGIVSLLAWSVGESMCRERWSEKLAAFDSVMKGSFSNATVARASLRGASAGLVALALIWSATIALQGRGEAASFLALGPWWENAVWFSIPLVAFSVAYGLYVGLFGQLLLVPACVGAVRRWRGWLGKASLLRHVDPSGHLVGGAIAAALGSVLFFPLVFLFPVQWGLPVWFLYSAFAVTIFMRYGIFTTLMMHVTAQAGSGAVPFLLADNGELQLQASLALLAVGAPLILSVRYLFSGAEFHYRYEDVPPHVRRIAQRERQKVELETARNIQASILPELPPEIYGVELASTYLPATEVGGDFYDVLALDDGRLAVAVGDVAGHGVSSGLVMSMAKSALAVQVTFEPEVEAVFRTLNRMVFQSARRRLLTTLCYAVLDPASRRLHYASAGHLFPYRISNDGVVSALESVSYPLGVRSEIDISVRAAQLEKGDYLFLFSDGVVEARPEESDDLYGFDRLEASLARHAGGSVSALRDGVLSDLAAFTAGNPREDDLTLLALRLP